jgi:hypothetical protein
MQQGRYVTSAGREPLPLPKQEIFLFQNYLEWINRIFFQREAAHRYFF